MSGMAVVVTHARVQSRVESVRRPSQIALLRRDQTLELAKHLDCFFFVWPSSAEKPLSAAHILHLLSSPHGRLCLQTTIALPLQRQISPWFLPLIIVTSSTAIRRPAGRPARRRLNSNSVHHRYMHLCHLHRIPFIINAYRNGTAASLATMSSNISARGAASRARSGTTSGGPAAKKPRTDGAKIGKQIFNVGMVSSYASIAIDNFLTKYTSGDKILQKDIESLEAAKDTVDQINPQLRNLVPQIADVPYLARSYDTSTADERAKMRAALKMGKGTEAAVHSMKAFNKSIKEGASQDAKRSPPSSLPSTPTQPVRASSRVSVPILPPTVVGKVVAEEESMEEDDE